MNTEDRRATVKAAHDLTDERHGKAPDNAAAIALVVIADVLTELAEGVKWCSHGYIETLCSGSHD